MEKKGTPVLTSGINSKICPRSKRSQVTVFIIIGLVVIAVGVLVYFLFPGIKTSFGVEEETPYQFVEGCLDQDFLQETINDISLQGGSLNPEHYLVYNGDNLEYLCYTNEYLKPCVVQQPILIGHIESEIENAVRQDADVCLDLMKTHYEEQGYEVNLRKGGMEVELLPQRIVFRFNSTLVLSKDGDTQNYNLFRVVLNNNLYELAKIASSIVEWETRYGDAETTLYMSYYRDLKVEKKIQTEGSTAYILTDRPSGFKFQFASRSMPWPPGYG